MVVGSYFEFIVLALGWIVYDGVWAERHGIVYLPFLGIVVKNVIESKQAGDDEGSAAVQSLKKIEVDTVVAVVVVFLAAARPEISRADEIKASFDYPGSAWLARNVYPALRSSGAYPACSDWWTDLRARLLAGLDADPVADATDPAAGPDGRAFGWLRPRGAHVAARDAGGRRARGGARRPVPRPRGLGCRVRAHGELQSVVRGARGRHDSPRAALRRGDLSPCTCPTPTWRHGSAPGTSPTSTRTCPCATRRSLPSVLRSDVVGRGVRVVPCNCGTHHKQLKLMRQSVVWGW